MRLQVFPGKRPVGSMVLGSSAVWAGQQVQQSQSANRQIIAIIPSGHCRKNIRVGNPQLQRGAKSRSNSGRPETAAYDSYGERHMNHDGLRSGNLIRWRFDFTDMQRYTKTSIWSNAVHSSFPILFVHVRLVPRDRQWTGTPARYPYSTSLRGAVVPERHHHRHARGPEMQWTGSWLYTRSATAATGGAPISSHRALQSFTARCSPSVDMNAISVPAMKILRLGDWLCLQIPNSADVSDWKPTLRHLWNEANGLPRSGPRP